MKKLVFNNGVATFVERSCLPLSAVCLVAGSMRDRLAALLGTQVTLCALEPAIPSVAAWAAIGRSARFYRVRGSAADAAIVLRERDGAAVAAAAFGETLATAPERPLSPIECDVLDRTAAALAGTLAAVCGEPRQVAPPSGSWVPGEFVTYFELAVEQPMAARIGVALSHEPVSQPVPALNPNDADGLPLEASVDIELVNMSAKTLLALAPGDLVPITRRSTIRGRLRIGGRTLATGICGVRDGRYALELEGCVA